MSLPRPQQAKSPQQMQPEKGLFTAELGLHWYAPRPTTRVIALYSFVVNNFKTEAEPTPS